jgi:hypothetical protein
MKVLVSTLLFVCGVFGNFSARAADTNRIEVGTDAAATSNSATTIMGASPSPTIGLPVTPQSLPPPLVNQVPPPPYVLFRQLMELTTQFGDTVISGEEDVAQFTSNSDTASVTFATSPQFGRHKKVSTWDTRAVPLSARFTSQFKGKVNWLGTIMVSSKNGIVLLPPADKGFVWKAISTVSAPSLKEVIIVPMPQGYGINVGVKSEGSAFGLSSVVGKLLSVFIGIGPSFSVQDGTTMPTGTWSQQYIVLEEDQGGIPFAIDLVTPQEQKAANNASQPPDRVQLAREMAVKQAEALADAMARLRQNTTITVNVPTNQVMHERKQCVMKEFTDSAGRKVVMCEGSKTGSYGVTTVIPQTATGQVQIENTAVLEKK